MLIAKNPKKNGLKEFIGILIAKDFIILMKQK